MSNKLVAHPETGKPAYEQVSYVEVERNQLEEEVNAKQAELDNHVNRKAELEAQVATTEEERAKAEAALEEAKRNVEQYDSITPQPESNEGAEGAGGETSDENAEGEVTVPVQVENNDPVF